MNVEDAVRTVLAVRQYEDRPVPAPVIERIVEAAHLTGSSRNGQPWHFVVVEDRAMLRRIAAEARSGPYTADAAFAVVVAVDHESPYGVSDASRAIQSMTLVAWEAGVGSNWVGFNNLEAVRPLLAIPETLDVVAVVPFGYPATPAGRGRKRRRPIGEVVHRGRFGAPWA